MLTSSSLSDKERDNTWLQLPVCRSYQDGTPDECKEEKCDHAHPPPCVMKYMLPNGYIVCCHDYVFRNGLMKRWCSRANCKYYHPPPHLEILVVNAGKNNKRLRAEHKIKQQQLISAYQQNYYSQPMLYYQPQTPAMFFPVAPAAMAASAAAAAVMPAAHVQTNAAAAVNAFNHFQPQAAAVAAAAAAQAQISGSTMPAPAITRAIPEIHHPSSTVAFASITNQITRPTSQPAPPGTEPAMPYMQQQQRNKRGGGATSPDPIATPSVNGGGTHAITSLAKRHSPSWTESEKAAFLLNASASAAASTNAALVQSQLQSTQLQQMMAQQFLAAQHPPVATATPTFAAAAAAATPFTFAYPASQPYIFGPAAYAPQNP